MCVCVCVCMHMYEECSKSFKPQLDLKFIVNCSTFVEA